MQAARNLLAYLMPPGADEFENFVNYWLDLKRADGFEKRQRAYWIDRVPPENRAPRWSILGDVFGVGVSQPKDPRETQLRIGSVLTLERQTRPLR